MTGFRIPATAALASTCVAIGTLLGGSVAAWAGAEASEISACYSNTKRHPPHPRPRRAVPSR